jgi:hypothetical protein
LESNLPPFWATNVPSQTNYTVSALGTLIVTNTASDLDIPTNYADLSIVVTGPTTVTNASIDTMA